MIHRIVLFLKFAPVFGRLSIVPLWNRKKHKTSVDGQTFKSLWISTLLMSQISTIVDSSLKARGCPGLGRGFSVLCVNANFMKLQRRVIIRIATILKQDPITLLIQKYLTDRAYSVFRLACQSIVYYPSQVFIRLTLFVYDTERVDILISSGNRQRCY